MFLSAGAGALYAIYDSAHKGLAYLFAKLDHISTGTIPDTSFRLLIYVVTLASVTGMCLLRIAWLGYQGHDDEIDRAGPRAQIIDRNGEIMATYATNRPLWFDPKREPLWRPPEETAKRLKAIFPELDERALTAQLASGRAGYISRNVTREQAVAVNAIGELALQFPSEPIRHYPNGQLAAHVLGYATPFVFSEVGRPQESRGLAGIELGMDSRLTEPALRYEPLQLSIDLRAQAAFEDELSSGMLATKALGAAGIVLDVETGEVIAMASLPEFDPNTTGPAGAVNVFNRATNGIYELGSTFKPLTVAAAIDAGVVRDFRQPWDASPLVIEGRTIRDANERSPNLTVPQALVSSSNTVTARVADALGPERLRQTMIDLGMNRRPVIELPAKGAPIWPQGTWGRVTNMTVGFGHGLAVTPLHLASAYAAMVNGGIWRPATLLKVQTQQTIPERRVFKPSTSARMRELLRLMVSEGNGRRADVAGLRVGGSTGSAEKAISGVYSPTRIVSTFAAAFPMDRPRYVVVIVLDEPQGTPETSFQRTSAFTAAPVAGRVIKRIEPFLGIDPDP